MGEPKLSSNKYITNDEHSELINIKQKEIRRLKLIEIAFLKKSNVAHEEGEGNWLVSYADMMTLLAGFFIILFSFSKIDPQKFEQLKKETTVTFGGEYKMPFGDLSNSLKQAVKDKHLEDQVFINSTDAGLEITFRGALFFESGSVLMREQATDLLSKLVPTIIQNGKDFGIIIEGHTDNIPISGGLFASNWELSSLRACTVLRYFLDRGFNPDKVKAIGLGDRRPVLPNEDKMGQPLPDNQSQNRRVVVKILKNFE